MADKQKRAKKSEPPPLPPEPDLLDELLAERRRLSQALGELAQAVEANSRIAEAVAQAVSALRDATAKLTEIARQDRTINLRLPDGRCATGLVPPRGVKTAGKA